MGKTFGAGVDKFQVGMALRGKGVVLLSAFFVLPSLILFSAPQASTFASGTHEGSYTNASIWSRGYVPSTPLHAVQMSTSSLGDFAISLADWQTKAAYHMLMVYPGSTLALDGRGATFESPALSEDDGGTYYADPSVFSIQTGASVPKTKLLLVGYVLDPSTGKTHVPTYMEPQYRFEDIYLAITNTAANDVTIDFARGTFDFDNGGNQYRIWSFGTGMLETGNGGELIRSETVRFAPGTVLKFSNLRFNGMSCSNVVDYALSGCTVDVASDFYIDGLAHVSFADGAQVSAKNIGKSYSPNNLDDSVIAIDGADTRVSTSADFIVGTKGGSTLNMRGGELNIGAYFGFGNTPPTAEQIVTLNQTGGKIVAESVVACRQASSSYLKAYLNLDGGELHAKRLYGSKTKIAGFLSTAVLSADGGTYCARGNITATDFPFIGYFDLAELGSKGLTIKTDYQNRILQSFTNKVGSAGRLVLEGSGTVYLGKDTYQSELVSDVANLVFDSEVTTCASRLAVTNGTSVSFASTAALALGGLKLDGGSVATFATSTRLTVDSIALGDFKVSLSEAFATGTYPLITVKGVVAQSDREAWMISDVYVGREAGKTYNLRCGDYNSASGTTVLSLEVGSSTTPVVTDAENIATPVDNLVVLGALAFTQAKDYVLTGQGRLRFEDTGAAAVTVASGIQKIDVPAHLTGTLAIDVSGGASLEFSKPVVNGGIDKSGTGVLSFGADAASELPAGFKLRDGTWKVDGPGVSSRGAVTIQTPNPSNAVVLATSVDTTVPGMTVLSGALVKTGAGRLTVENANAAMQLYGNWSIHGKLKYGATVPDGAMDFPADGTPPTQNYSAFNIVEGEIALCGTGAGAPTSSSQYFSTAEVFVGMRSPLDVAVAPGLAIDHAKVDLGGVQRWVFIGEKPIIGDTRGKANCPYLAISNKSEVTSHVVYIGDNCDADTTAQIYPHIMVDDSKWTLTGNENSKIVLSGGKTCHTTLDVVNGSTLLSGATPVLWKGDVEATLDGASLFAGVVESSACTFQFGNNAKGTFRVAGGSTLCCTGVVFATGASSLVNDVRFAFDGGYLDPAATTFAFQSPMSGCHVVALDGGLRLAVPEGGTWTLPAMVEGTGPIVACGLGTVALDGVFANAFAGAGTFSGGTLRGATVKLAVDDEGAIASDIPTFSGTTYGGRVFVDLGRTAENPIGLDKISDITVMRYEGTAPSPATFKLSGTGHSRAYGVFEAADGQVVLRSVEGGRGMAIIFR